MALESATYINQLRDDAPSGLDPKSQGDDHLRLIKGALKRTFPNVTGAVNVTQAQLNGLGVAGALVPSGCIMMWPYIAGSIPAGWGECDGVTRLTDGRLSPDLRNMFVRGASPTLPVATVGGTETHTHGITLTVAGHVLTEAEMPAHTHDTDVGGTYTFAGKDLQAVTRAPGKTKSTGGNQPHTHAGSTGVAAASPNIPPFHALIYIIKL